MSTRIRQRAHVERPHPWDQMRFWGAMVLVESEYFVSPPTALCAACMVPLNEISSTRGLSSATHSTTTGPDLESHFVFLSANAALTTRSAASKNPRAHVSVLFLFRSWIVATSRDYICSTIPVDGTDFELEAGGTSPISLEINICSFTCGLRW